MVITETADGYSVLDAAGRIHEVSSEGLGNLIRRIVEDPDLPQYETQAAQVDDFATQIASAVLPNDFKFIAPPAIGLLKKAVHKLSALNVDRTVRKRTVSPEERKRKQEEAERRQRESRETSLIPRKPASRPSSLRAGRRPA
jgi:hypothetical protein